ncbi:protein kinase, putative [Bodo saltans]|uniref:Protein kinase, putative n=1 Tax=Bodo saltans TaxID=75058 RepID=A0A0S4JFP7_BODSA|nr:protein kinase, putative [Bodo saltans]|eukprot:CUG88961.1 protein kinase, putative [Bodo saltans]
MPFDLVADEPSDIVKEIEVLSGVDSPFCVQYYGAFFHDGVAAVGGPSLQGGAASSSVAAFSSSPSVCIVQQLIEGGSVLDLLETLRSQTSIHQTESVQQLRAGRTPPQSSTPVALSATSTAAPIMSDEQIASVVVDVLHALVYLHDQSRIVHRDIKCANILLSVTDGRCRLCDFGTGAKKETASDQRRTTIGTPGWMAPEVWSGSMQHSFPADIWTLGATVLEMCLRTSPSANPLFSQYITVVSQISCSYVPSSSSSAASSSGPATFMKASLPMGGGPSNGGGGVGKTFSDLEPLMNSPLLFDFVACCLRRDPSQRPPARHLLMHPFLMENGMTTGSPRKVALVKRMADQLLTSAAAANNAMNADLQSPLTDMRNTTIGTTNYALGGTMDPKHIPKQPRVLDGSGRLIGQKKNAAESISVQHLFDHGLDNAIRNQSSMGISDANFDSGVPICPPLLATMWTSEPFRVGGPAAPSTTPKAPFSQKQQSVASSQCGVFSDVMSPATADARVTMQRVFSIYRSLGGSQTAASTVENFQEPYSMKELQSSNVSFEHHERLMDRLLQGLHSVENLHHDINDLRSRQHRPMQRDPSVPVAPEDSFSLRACQWMTSFLLTNHEDSDNMQHMFEYFEELQQNPFRHHYRLKGRRGETVGYAANNNNNHHVGAGGRLSALTMMRKVSGSALGPTATTADGHSLLPGTRPMSSTEQILSTPSVPVYNPPPVSLASSAAGQHHQQQQPSMADPAATLFNRWLGEQKQRTWAQL